jgi:predicted RNA methylase
LLFNRKKGEWLGQFLTPNRLAEAISRFVGWEKDIKYNIGDCCAGTGSLLFPLLREIIAKKDMKESENRASL